MQLLEAGNTVVATCRSPQKAETLTSLAESHKGRLIIQALDVNDEAFVKVLKPCGVPLFQNSLSRDACAIRLRDPNTVALHDYT